MKFDKNLATVHAYLCADGYVIKNPESQKHRYYRIGFRNTNLVLLKDFQKCFYNYFKIKPILKEGERCDKSSKEIHKKLIEEFGSFYSREWKMPKLNNNLSRVWLRAFFDCEGWVFCKKHQNRHIGLESVNKEGLKDIKESLSKFGIRSLFKEKSDRRIYRIDIYGKENIQRFKKEISFLHPKKAKKLDETINDYMVYDWEFLKSNKDIKRFVKNIIKQKAKLKKPYIIRIISNRERNLKRLQKELKRLWNIKSKVYKSINGIGTVYYELSIQKKNEVKKLIKNRLIGNLFKYGK